MRSCRSLLLSFLVMTPSMFLSGCGHDPSCSRCLSSVFGGFSLVDSYARTEKSRGAFSRHPLPFPKSLDHGWVYVFEPNSPTTTELVAITTLPTRLRECGATRIEAPRGPNDLASSNLGGPVWEIRFDLAHCRGRISNRLNPALRDSRRGWPSGSFDDYVLELSADQ
jgi:hypothetical protein